ncbi:MAG: immunogenic rane protein [Rhodospirillales bacterium]|nr:immunogenic rane protein [Rhodospirillales bacterium]
MLFSSAFAQTAAGGGSDFQAQLVQFAPLIMIAGVFYFLLIRPQQQRAKQLKTAVAALRRGDKIVTAGGIIASISRVISDDEIEAEIAPGVKARILRSTITTILSKPEPAGKGGKSSEPKDVTAKLLEGEINEIDATSDANMTADSSKKRRPPTKGAAAKAAEAETKPTDTPADEPAKDESVKTDKTN